MLSFFTFKQLLDLSLCVRVSQPQTLDYPCEIFLDSLRSRNYSLITVINYIHVSNSSIPKRKDDGKGHDNLSLYYELIKHLKMNYTVLVDSINLVTLRML